MGLEGVVPRVWYSHMARKLLDALRANPAVFPARKDLEKILFPVPHDQLELFARESDEWSQTVGARVAAKARHTDEETRYFLRDLFPGFLTHHGDFPGVDGVAYEIVNESSSMIDVATWWIEVKGRVRDEGKSFGTHTVQLNQPEQMIGLYAELENGGFPNVNGTYPCARLVSADALYVFQFVTYAGKGKNRHVVDREVYVTPSSFFTHNVLDPAKPSRLSKKKDGSQVYYVGRGHLGSLVDAELLEMREAPNSFDGNVRLYAPQGQQLPSFINIKPEREANPNLEAPEGATWEQLIAYQPPDTPPPAEVIPF